MGFSESFSTLKDVIVGIDNANALGTLMELQQQAYAILDENRELRLKLEEIERTNILESEVVCEGEAYYKISEGPFCTRCFDVDRKLVRLSTPSALMVQRKGNFYCPNCETYYNVTPRKAK